MKKLFTICCFILSGALAAQGFVKQYPSAYLMPRDMTIINNNMYTMLFDGTGTFFTHRILEYNSVGDTTCIYVLNHDPDGVINVGMLRTSDNNLLLCYDSPYGINPGYKFIKISPSGIILDSAFISGHSEPNYQTSRCTDGSNIYFTARDSATYDNMIYKLDQNLNVVGQTLTSSVIFGNYQDLKTLPNHDILLVSTDYWSGGVNTYRYDSNCNFMDSAFFNIGNGYMSTVWKYSQHVISDSTILYNKYTSTGQIVYTLDLYLHTHDSVIIGGGAQIFSVHSFPNDRYLCGFRDGTSLYAAIMDTNFNVLNYTPIAQTPVLFDLEYHNNIIGILTESDFNNFAYAIEMDTTLNPIMGNLSGSVYKDVDSNCNNVLNNDIPLNNAVITATSPGFTSYAIPSGGVYGMNLYEESYTISSSDPNGFHDVCNNSLNVTVAGGNNYPDNDFFKKQYAHDLYLDAYAGNFSAPLQSGSINVLTGNFSASTINSYTLKLIGDTAVNYVSASISPASVSGDTLIWNFGSTPSVTTYNININYTIPPTTAAGTVLQFTSHIYSILPGDENSLNNDDTLQTVVLNSFDPNDKAVNPVGTGPQGFIRNNQELEYRVRFQNTGNYPAANIYVIDELDPDLDISTLVISTASHPYTASIVNSNTLRMDFKNIDLADSNSNEPSSHGYFIYKIKPKTGVVAGATIPNEAGIYFDFNSPVITNQTINTIQNTVGIEPGDETIYGKLYPNPASEFITLELPVNNSGENMFIAIKDLQGRILHQRSVQSQSNLILDVSSFPAGIYLVTVNNTIYKFVKK